MNKTAFQLLIEALKERFSPERIKLYNEIINKTRTDEGSLDVYKQLYVLRKVNDQPSPSEMDNVNPESLKPQREEDLTYVTALLDFMGDLSKKLEGKTPDECIETIRDTFREQYKLAYSNRYLTGEDRETFCKNHKLMHYFLLPGVLGGEQFDDQAIYRLISRAADEINTRFGALRDPDTALEEEDGELLFNDPSTMTIMDHFAFLGGTMRAADLSLEQPFRNWANDYDDRDRKDVVPKKDDKNATHNLRSGQIDFDSVYIAKAVTLPDDILEKTAQYQVQTPESVLDDYFKQPEDEKLLFTLNSFHTELKDYREAREKGSKELNEIDFLQKAQEKIRAALENPEGLGTTNREVSVAALRVDEAFVDKMLYFAQVKQEPEKKGVLAIELTRRKADELQERLSKLPTGGSAEFSKLKDTVAALSSRTACDGRELVERMVAAREAADAYLEKREQNPLNPPEMNELPETAKKESYEIAQELRNYFNFLIPTLAPVIKEKNIRFNRYLVNNVILPSGKGVPQKDAKVAAAELTLSDFTYPKEFYLHEANRCLGEAQKTKELAEANVKRNEKLAVDDYLFAVAYYTNCMDLATGKRGKDELSYSYMLDDIERDMALSHFRTPSAKEYWKYFVIAATNGTGSVVQPDGTIKDHHTLKTYLAAEHIEAIYQLVSQKQQFIERIGRMPTARINELLTSRTKLREKAQELAETSNFNDEITEAMTDQLYKDYYVVVQRRREELRKEAMRTQSDAAAARKNMEQFIPSLSQDDLANTRSRMTNALGSLTKLLESKQTVNGSYQYDYILKSLEIAKNYWNKMGEDPQNYNMGEFCGLLKSLKGQAERYLDYKAADPHRTDSNLERDRIDAAALVRDLAEQGVKAIAAEREKDQLIHFAGPAGADGMRDVGAKEFESQKKALEDLKKVLSETRGILHGESSSFTAVMDGLDDVIGMTERMKEAPDDLDQLTEYRRSLDSLLTNSRRYLAHKRDHNDFGDISEKRIRNVGRLELTLQTIRNATAGKIEKAVGAWADNLLEGLKKEAIDPSNPYMLSRVVILNPENSVTDQELVRANALEDPAEQVDAYMELINKMVGIRRMAFAKIGPDGKPVNPLKGTDNVAEWIRDQITTDKAGLTPDHKLYLYRMAKQNRLFLLPSAKGWLPDDSTYRQICVEEGTQCRIMEKDAPVVGENSQKITDCLSYNKRVLFVNQMLESIRTRCKQLDSEDVKQVNAQQLNILAKPYLDPIVDAFPDWFNDPKDVEVIGRMANYRDSRFRKGIPPEETEWRSTHVDWTTGRLQVCKDILRLAGVDSFSQLIGNYDVKNSIDDPYEAGTPMRMAERIMTDLLKKRKLTIKGTAYALSENGLVEARFVTPEYRLAARVIDIRTDRALKQLRAKRNKGEKLSEKETEQLHNLNKLRSNKELRNKAIEKEVQTDFIRQAVADKVEEKLLQEPEDVFVRLFNHEEYRLAARIVDIAANMTQKHLLDKKEKTGELSEKEEKQLNQLNTLLSDPEVRYKAIEKRLQSSFVAQAIANNTVDKLLQEPREALFDQAHKEEVRVAASHQKEKPAPEHKKEPAAPVKDAGPVIPAK